jgi:hypothetical protein
MTLNDEDDTEGFATFGMVYSELIELLASIKISSDGLDAVLKTNKGLSQKEIALILVAIENYKTLYDMLSLGGTVSKRDVLICMRRIFAKVDLMNQLDFLKGNLIQKNTPRKEKTLITHTEEPDQLVKGLFGDENC